MPNDGWLAKNAKYLAGTDGLWSSRYTAQAPPPQNPATRKRSGKLYAQRKGGVGRVVNGLPRRVRAKTFLLYSAYFLVGNFGYCSSSGAGLLLARVEYEVDIHSRR